MAVWTFLDYVELTGRNPIREWLDRLPEDDQAKIDARLLQMVGMRTWPEKWISKYKTTELFEFRIKGRVQYRPLGTYIKDFHYILLAGVIEKGGKIPKQSIESAEERLANYRKDRRHAVPHQYDPDDDLEAV